MGSKKTSRRKSMSSRARRSRSLRTVEGKENPVTVPPTSQNRENCPGQAIGGSHPTPTRIRMGVLGNISLHNTPCDQRKGSPSTPSSIHCLQPQKVYDTVSAPLVPRRGKRRLNMEDADSTPQMVKRRKSSLDSSTDVESDSSPRIEGRRIVNLEHLTKELARLGRHSTLCTFGEMRLVKETRKGLVTFLTYKCHMCEKEENIRSEPQTDLTVNTALVFGAISVGLGQSQTQELLANLNVPSITPRNYLKHEAIVDKIWDKHLANEMEAALEEEKTIAIQQNRVDEKGRPFITVIVDGGWAKRSYRHSFSSKSGLAVIIGAATGKLLYLGIKNKFCCICARVKEGEEAPEHNCNKNYRGTATAMEQTIILEGLQYIFRVKGMWPKYVIGDGDSSVYAKIRQGLKEVGPKVMKVECSNHVRKNYRKKLHGLLEDTQRSKAGRDLLRPRLHRLVKALSCAVKENVGNVTQMVEDLRNGPRHVFGDHTKCDTVRYCRRKDSGEPNKVAEFQGTGLMDVVRGWVDQVVRLAPRLVTNTTTNPAESMMSKVAKFTGGKRIDFCKGRSFDVRCKGAGLSQLLGPAFMISTWKSHYACSPGVVSERVLQRKYTLMNRRRLAFRATKAAGEITWAGRYDCKRAAQPDKDYGPNADQPDMTPEELASEMDRIQEDNRKRVMTDEDRANLEERTRGQASNPEWVEVRHWLLTASDFGEIINRRADTSCHSYLRSRINGKNLDQNEAIIYGRLSEEFCRLSYEEKTGEKVLQCGIFVEPQFSYLGASPDGLIGEDGCFEAKALFSIRHKKLREALLHPDEPHALCYDFEENWEQRGTRKDRRKPIDPNGKLILKPTHKYWHQVQGQMAISRRTWCDVVLRTDVDMEVIRVHFDQDVWEDTMKPRLQRFYENCLLPELADSRVTRGMRARDPPYILEAQEQKAKKGADKLGKAKLKLTH